MEGKANPNTSENWSDIMAVFNKQKSSQRRADYAPRGLQLMRQGYNDLQHVEATAANRTWVSPA